LRIMGDVYGALSAPRCEVASERCLVAAVSVTVVVIAMIMAVSIVVTSFVVTAAVVFIIVTSAVIFVLFVLAVMMAIVVAKFTAVFAAVEISLPPAMMAPVSVLTANGESTVVAEARVVGTVDVAAEANRTVEPGARSEEDSAGKPCGAVVAEGGASIGGVVVVPVGACGLDADVYGDLYFGFESGGREAERRQKSERQKPQ